MPASARQRGTPSNPHPSTTSARQPSRPINNAPAYQSLAHPLNPDAQYALHNLPTSHTLNEVKKRLLTATNHLNDVTGDLNDQYSTKKFEFDKKKSSNAARARELESSQGAEDEDDDQERHMNDAWKEVENLTGKLEARTRQVIDIQARVENTETVLKELNANVGHGHGSTQSTLGASQFRSQTQRRRRGQQRSSDDEDESEDNDTNQAEAPTSTLNIFKNKLTAAESNYSSLSMNDRYTSHNTYIGFRQIVHDARHPNDDVPMPHHSTWFPSSPRNPTDTSHQSSNGKNRSKSNKQNSTQQASDSSDDEIQIAREKRSIRCPITLLPLANPLTSTRCPHSFESDAILNMLGASGLRAHAAAGNGKNDGPVLNANPRDRSGVNAIKCPECSVLLTKDTLRVDPALVRKIKKIAELEKRQRDGDDNDDDDDDDDGGGGYGGRRAEEVTSSPVKSMRGGWSQSAQSAKREVSMVPDSQIVDLGSEEDVDEDVDVGSGEDVEDEDR
ncbi:MAG: hypothetical protein L6R36_004283 [Xanthoria steineri]|nr:MAG: hypothetical protein L6R36_004283 [Xanthoria steineri]